MKKIFSYSLPKLELSLPKLLGHSVTGLKIRDGAKKKYPKFVEKSFSFLDDIICFIFRRQGNKKTNEVLQVAWGPLIVGLIVITLFFGVFGIWAAVAPIEGAVLAIGEVVLSSNRQVIQHLEGGMIREILAKEGDFVEKGQPLVYLSDTSAKANLGVLAEKMLVLLCTEARLMAILGDKKEIDFPDEIKFLSNEETRRKAVENQSQLFSSYNRTIGSQIDILHQRIEQLKNELRGLDAQMDSAKKQFFFIEEELTTKRKLLAEGYISKPYVLNLEKQYAEAQGRVGHYEALIAQTHQKIGENDLEIIHLNNSSQDRTNKELKEVNGEIADLRERLTAARDVLSRTVIRSPQDGTVTGLKYHTSGGVITPGAQIMDIVPTNDDLIIDSKVQTRNIEEILTARKKGNQVIREGEYEGLKVKVRLSAYNARKVGLIEGVVTQVSADAFSESNGMRYYLIRVVIPKSKLAELKGVELYPGMPAEIYIVTQSRTLLVYLFNPILSSFEKAFRER